MKYSIIIPVYNAEKFLVSCINSIFQSGLKNFEIILINDGSIDNSEKICKDLCKQHQEIVYIFQDNEGVSAARNAGIKIARGEYILFCDADDVFAENCFENLDDYVNTKIDVLIYGMSIDYYHKGLCYREDSLVYPKEGYQHVNLWSRDFEKMYQYNVLSSVWNKIYRKDIIEKNNLCFDEDMILLEDLVFSIQYLEHCKIIYFLNQIAYRYRQSENEHNAQRRLERIPSINSLVKDIRNNMENLNSALMKRCGCKIESVESISYRIFYMLLFQKLYYANIYEIEMCSMELFKSDYHDQKKIAKLGKRTLQLYENLNCKRCWRIKIHNEYLQIRHCIAVLYKYYKCRLRGN